MERGHGEWVPLPDRPSGPGFVFAHVARPHIVAIGALGTLLFGWIFTEQFALQATLWSAIDWFVVNLLNRIVDVHEDTENAIPGTHWIAMHRASITCVVVAGLLASLIITASGPTPLITCARVAFTR